jgi:LmbE family N-acetylglucosaminyl deacetylase
MAKIRFVYILTLLSFYFTTFAQPPRSYTSSEILLQLKKLNTVGSVLYIAAHPDDENTRLIAYLANEKCLRTGYLSLTRGDGGQNLIGPEQGIELGVIRTQELLAARRIDGGEQFFTRAYDFGFSKSHEETLAKWNKDSILSDMVWVIRNFRPDIIITRFATDGSGGHGHHTSSAILAEEAFDAAGDPSRFPEQLKHVQVWKPRRLFWNVSTRFQNPNADMSAYLKLDVGGYNPLLGKSYGEIAAESRSMHKSQGFGSAKQRGEYFEYFKPIKGDTSNLKDIFDGIDFTWNRVPNSKNIQQQLSQAFKNYDAQDPTKITQPILELKKLLKERIKVEYELDYHNLLCTELAMAANGVYYEYVSKDFQVSIGEHINFDHNALNRSLANKEVVKTGMAVKFYINSLSDLHWLKNPIRDNRFQYDFYDSSINEKLPPVHLLIVDRFKSGDVFFENDITKPMQYKWVDPEKGELYRPVVITPPVMINVSEDVLVFDGSGKHKILKVILKAGKDNVNGKLSFNTRGVTNLNSMDLNNSISSLSKLSIFTISPLVHNFELIKKAKY